MNNSKILKARQLKKNEALNEIRKIFNPKYEFPYSEPNPYTDFDDHPSSAEQREERISDIIKQLEKELKKLKVDNF